jgi:hypothetical protein
MPGALVNCQRRNLRSLAEPEGHASALAILRKAGQQSLSPHGGRVQKEPLRPICEPGLAANACGKLTTRQAQGRR